MPDLKERRDTLIKECRAIAEKAKAEGRDFLTEDERKTIDERLTEVKSINQTLIGAAESKNIFDQLDAMAGMNPAGLPDSARRLDFSAKMATDTVAKMLPDGISAKALAPSGSVVVGQEFSPSPIELGKPANTLLAVLPYQQHSTPNWKYLSQSVRTNNAAVVAEGAVKPTSVYSVVEVDGSLSVIAHLSEPCPRYWLVDNDSLQQFMTNELLYGLQGAVEAKVLADINATSGIQTQTYSSSVLETLRKSVTALEVVGYNAAWFLLNPTDWEQIELGLLTQESFDFRSLPFDPVTRRLWGIPVVVSLAQAAGVSHTVATGAAAIDTDTTGVQVAWSETSNSDDWSRNLLRARCEGRSGTSVYRPFGVVKGDLAA